MDIYTTDPNAVGAIFGEDYTKGPLRAAPPILAQFLKDWPVHPNDVLTIGLEPPPEYPLDGFKLTLHRVTVVLNGEFGGYALRMDDVSVSTLQAYDMAWRNYRMLHAH